MVNITMYLIGFFCRRWWTLCCAWNIYTARYKYRMNLNANFKQWKTEETKFKIACESPCQMCIFVLNTTQNICFVSKLISQNGWYKRAIERNLNQLSFQTEILSKTCWMTYVKSITLNKVKPRVHADQIKQQYVIKIHRPKTDSILSHIFTYSLHQHYYMKQIQDSLYLHTYSQIRPTNYLNQNSTRTATDEHRIFHYARCLFSNRITLKHSQLCRPLTENIHRGNPPAVEQLSNRMNN